MNRDKRFGRRSVVQNQIQKITKLTPEHEDEQPYSKGPKKALFNDDTSFIMRRTLKPLHEINNFQCSLSKSKSHEKLYDENHHKKPSYVETFSKHNQFLLSPPSKSKFLESSIVKKRTEPNAPVLQSKDLFNSLIDSPCTQYEKVQFNNALSSATKYLLNRHLESVNKNADIFVEKTPEINAHPTNAYNINKDESSNLNNYNNITVKPNKFQTDSQTQTSDISSVYEDIEEMKKVQIENVRQIKSKCCDIIKTRFKEIELEIEKHFNIEENKVIESYNTLLSKLQADKSDSSESEALDATIETVKEKNYTRMTGTFGILNNLKQDCSFLKTPKVKGKTREEMLNQGTLTPCTMSFMLQEQLMHLNSSS